MISCNKNDDTPKEEQSFYALKTGNSWKYQYFQRIEQTDEFESLDAFDDVIITGTSEINGNTYYNFETTTSGNDGTNTSVPQNGVVLTKIRDSLGYLVDEAGIIYFSNINPNQEYLRKEGVGFDSYGLLKEGSENIEVPAGNFLCSVNEWFGKLEDGSKAPFRDYNIYSKEIGQIKTTYSFASVPLYRAEKILVSYDLSN